MVASKDNTALQFVPRTGKSSKQAGWSIQLARTIGFLHRTGERSERGQWRVASEDNGVCPRYCLSRSSKTDGYLLVIIIF